MRSCHGTNWQKEFDCAYADSYRRFLTQVMSGLCQGGFSVVLTTTFCMCPLPKSHASCESKVYTGIAQRSKDEGEGKRMPHTGKRPDNSYLWAPFNWVVFWPSKP